ncbi:MAG: TIGR04076 family protein [Oscillospiraceae bacterium]|nr:TIGR04076 family protein [Oscillospiraceae bacterium]
MNYKCKITVLKRCFNEELAAEYGAEGITPCPFFREGDTFITDYCKPENFCEDAWQAIQYYVFALSMGSEQIYSDWVNRPGIAVNCCNDGIRPVVFKIERLDEAWDNAADTK